MTGGEEPVLDRSRLTLITRGDDALAREFIDALLEEAEPMISEIFTHCAAGEGAALRANAHKLKGMATEVGALRLRAAALALEAETEPGRWAACAERVRDALAAVRREA